MAKKNNWMVTKSIKFDKNKLDTAKKSGTIKQLPKKCREQLDLLIFNGNNQKQRREK